MLDGDHCGHAVPYVRPGKILILFLQDIQLSGIGVDDIGKSGLKAGQMGAALRVVDIVAEAKHIFMKLIHILEGALHGNAVALSRKGDHIAYRLPGFVQIPDEARDPLRLMILDHLRLFLPLIRKNNGERRVQISRLMQPAFDLILLKTGLLKDRIVREKIDAGPCVLRLSHHGKQPVGELYRGNPPLVPVFINFSAVADAHGHSGGKGVDHGGTDAVQAAAGLVRGMIEFSSRMQRGEHQALRAHALFMHPHGDPSSVVVHSGRAVRLQRHADPVAYAGQMLVHRVVHDLIDQMVQSLRGNASDIHARPFPDRFKALQHRNAGGVITVLIHSVLPISHFSS